MFDGTISAIIMRTETNCIESVSCEMKQIHVWWYYLSNYHENRNKLHRICKLRDEADTCLTVLSQQLSWEKKTNCIESVSCRMKQIHVWRYYLSNYHENRNKLHRSCKLWDEVGRWVWRYYPSNDQGGLRKVAMNQLVMVWSSYMCLKVLSQQWSGGHRQIAKNQFVVGWGSYTFLKVLSQQKLGQAETNCNESGTYRIQ